MNEIKKEKKEWILLKILFKTTYLLLSKISANIWDAT